MSTGHPDERVAQLIRQGQLALQQGDTTKAQNYLKAAVDLEPTNANAWLWLGGTQMDQPAEAKYALERALELDPNNFRAQQGLAHVNAQLASNPAPPPTVDEYDYEQGYDYEPYDYEQPYETEDTYDEEPSEAPGYLSVEQELRAAIQNTNEPIEPVELTPQDLRAGLIAAEGDNFLDEAPSSNEPFFSSENGGGLYRIIAGLLTVSFLIGPVCLILALLGMLPF